MFEITCWERSVAAGLGSDGERRNVGSEYTWVLCWTDSLTIGEIASSRSVGMIGLVPGGASVKLPSIGTYFILRRARRAVVVWYGDIS